jgi:hypothetical protein
VILQTFWLEEKGGASVPSFAETDMSYCISGDMTRTDKNNTEIDFRLLVSFCDANSVVLHLCLANYGQSGQNVLPFGRAPCLNSGNINAMENRPVESLEESVSDRRSVPMRDIDQRH